VLAYVGRIHNLKDLEDLKDLKGAGLCSGTRLQKGEVFAYVGRNQNLKDLKVCVWRADLSGLTQNTPTEPLFISSTRASALES